jgi:hypothetical protein
VRAQGRRRKPRSVHASSRMNGVLQLAAVNGNGVVHSKVPLAHADVGFWHVSGSVVAG